MYSMLQRNLKNYFKLYNQGEGEYRLQMAELLKAFEEKRIYDTWKVTSPRKYKQVNHLVYRIQESIPLFPRFETLSRDLWAMDYEAICDEQFESPELMEQLKLINLCLGGAYLH